MQVMENTSPSDIICFCFGITQQDIVSIILEKNPQSVVELTGLCEAGNGCTSCWDDLETLVQKYTKLS